MHFARKKSNRVTALATPLLLTLFGALMVAAAWGFDPLEVMHPFVTWNQTLTFQGVLAGLEACSIPFTPLEPYRIALGNGFTAHIAESCSIVLVFGTYLLALALVARNLWFALLAAVVTWGVLTLLNGMRIIAILQATMIDKTWFELAHAIGNVLSVVVVVGMFYLTLAVGRGSMMRNMRIRRPFQGVHGFSL